MGGLLGYGGRGCEDGLDDTREDMVERAATCGTRMRVWGGRSDCKLGALGYVEEGWSMAF